MENTQLRQKLELLLNESRQSLSDKPIWIWGAGNTASLYQEGFRRIEKDGFCIAGYIDRNAESLNGQFGGKTVISPETLELKQDICILICTIRPDTVKQIQSECAEKEIECHPIDEVILGMHQNEVLKCFDLLEDEFSQTIYYELTKARIKAQHIAEGIQSYPTYFLLPEFKKKNEQEVFVDCGAYDGDTIHEYLKQKCGVFQKIIAFEPDKDNFKKLQAGVKLECEKWNLQQEKIELYPYAVGEKNNIGIFERYEQNSGVGSKLIVDDKAHGEECKVIALDEFLNQKYTFLKADIESFEYKMLLGAQKSIKKNKPMLAICIYHNAIDFYSVPLLIKQILPEYKLAIRHHLDDTSETVVYAWVE